MSTSACDGSEAAGPEATGVPRVGITMGDPMGIGPEVILKALAHRSFDAKVEVYGSRQVLRREARALQDLDGIGPGLVETLNVIDVDQGLKWKGREGARAPEMAARMQGDALQAALAAWDRDDIDAICTAPWNKALFAEIGGAVEGHTEVLARHFEAPEVVMMLGGRRLRVALVTTHVGVADVSRNINEGRLWVTLETTLRGLRRNWGIDKPRIAVCGLNPHAGEGGHMGHEEIEVIAPTVVRFREAHQGQFEVVGPLPSDTLFAGFREGRSPYDAVVCMYHDQGLIPLKLLHFGESANYTLGLPAVRTSVDHGTAYDIAGQGVADEGSMVFAIEEAAAMVRHRRRIGSEGA